MSTFDKRANVGRHFGRPFAKGARVDDGVVGIVVDIGGGSEDPVDTQGPGFTRRGIAFHARRAKVVRRAIGHRVRKLRRVGHPHTGPTFKVAADNQGHLGHFLHAIQKSGHGVRLGRAGLAGDDAIDDDHSTDAQFLHQLHVTAEVGRLGTVRFAKAGDNHQLGHLVAQRHGPHPALDFGRSADRWRKRLQLSLTGARGGALRRALGYTPHPDVGRGLGGGLQGDQRSGEAHE